MEKQAEELREALAEYHKTDHKTDSLVRLHRLVLKLTDISLYLLDELDPQPEELPKVMHFVDGDHELGPAHESATFIRAAFFSSSSGGWAFSDGHVRLTEDVTSFCVGWCPRCLRDRDNS